MQSISGTETGPKIVLKVQINLCPKTRRLKIEIAFVFQQQYLTFKRCTLLRMTALHLDASMQPPFYTSPAKKFKAGNLVRHVKWWMISTFLIGVNELLSLRYIDRSKNKMQLNPGSVLYRHRVLHDQSIFNRHPTCSRNLTTMMRSTIVNKPHATNYTKCCFIQNFIKIFT